MKNRWLRRLAYALGGLLTVVAALVVAIYGVTWARTGRTFQVAATPVPVAHDSATRARGEHLVTAIGKCAECHGSDYAGKVFVDDPALGRVVARNLTPGGDVARYSDAEFARAIRHGVRKNGQGLLIMPSSDYASFSDEDVGAVIAYLRSLPPVAKPLPATELHFLARALWASGQLPLMDALRMDHAKRAPERVAVAPTAEYGHYLADVGGCTGCHGPGLSGGKIPGTPPDWRPAANLTPAGNLGKWTYDDFTRALRTGRRPDGSPIDSIMPWKATAKMTDDEIQAVYAFLKTVPAKPFGNR
ncbi:cytochrome c class I [Gemmatirosa kalamazoonensis]|uniref:Cytochrome c class I n=1 Tax=Gemmatirosa kalamazoonensis TaxID=861299 RepID=W0RF45_9BACT|nr:c-type cytochrome [Gemmatirosa kalamazoonensis]AHG88008.1 cytochrome c class I [Gemmatirosa kalamazoonensis]